MTESLPLKPKRINFDSSERPQAPELLLGCTTIEITSDVVDFINTHYSIISGILGLSDYPENYNLRIEYTDDNWFGTHDSPEENPGTGIITLNAGLVMSADYELLPEEEDSDRYELASLLRAIAHELFHKRHAVYFPHSYASRRSHYITASTDYDEYNRQGIEVWANIFTLRYLELVERTQEREWTGLSRNISELKGLLNR